MSSAEVAEKVVQNFMFLRPKFWMGGPPKFLRAFVNRHLFRPTGTGQVWLRSHGWSFIYADEIKKKNKLQR